LAADGPRFGGPTIPWDLVMKKHPFPYRAYALFWMVVLAVAGCTGSSSSTPSAANQVADASKKTAVERD
jgi:hypothetical protein